MDKIGMTLSRDQLDAPLAEHFGKAKWLLVLDGDDSPLFLRNTGLDGHFVAETFAAAGVRDVVAAHLGPGALEHLAAAGIRIWKAEPDVAASEIAARLRRGELKPFDAADARHHGGYHGAHGARGGRHRHGPGGLPN